MESPLYWFKQAAYLAGMPTYAAMIRARTALTKSHRERLDIAKSFRFRGYSLRPFQVDDEILSLLHEVEQRRPKRVLEIGTARGGTLYLLLNALPASAHIASVDLPHGPYGGGYPHWKIPFFHALALGGPRLSLFRGSSQDPEMRDQVVSALGGPIDFLLIDGDHTLEGVRRDFELYRHAVAPGGLIAFHDIVPHHEPEVNVLGLWNELKTQYRHREFVRNWDQGSCGIGVLFV